MAVLANGCVKSDQTRLCWGRGSSRRPGYPTVGAAGQIRESRGERPCSLGRPFRSKSGGHRRLPLRGVRDTGGRGWPTRCGVRALRFGARARGRGRQQRGRLEPRWRHRPPGAPAYPRVVNVESPASRYLAEVLETLVADGLGEGSEVVILHVDTGFGREVAEGAAMAARRLGLRWRSVSFRPGRARDVLAQVPTGDVLLSAGTFDDDVAIAQWDSERRWRAVGLVAAGVDELRHAIGDRVDGLYGPCQWFDDGTVDPADGPSSEWFSQRYRDANGAEPPYPAAAAFAAGVLWQRCAKLAGTVESLPVMAASQRLDTTTLFGRFRVDPLTGVQTGHQIRVVQWRDGQRVLVDRPPHRT